MIGTVGINKLVGLKTRCLWGGLFLIGMVGSVAADALGVSYSEPLKTQIEQALQAKGEDYKPRTEHLNADGKPVYTNRLILDSSPYLVQHAHNPVNWYSWGPEAFAQAKKENKPIFLSIGYSTCHWCHVMEKESFESPLAADFLNQHFIAIKVDREQRPDVDSTFMDAVVLLQGSGGWPMTVFLTPDGQPFYGGTYYPLPNLMTLLGKVSNLWKTQQEQVIKTAAQVTAAVQQQSRTKQAIVNLNQEIIPRAIEGIMSRYDDMQGGFSQAPKFPNEVYLFLLLDQLSRNSSPELYQAVKETLDAMAAGGIYDHVGGGFHRYATDNSWLVPHFEKMLYNQAHLGRIYSQFYKLSGDPEYARVSRQIFDYVLTDMTAPEGGFYSASDADSEGAEGTFFLWQLDELKKQLSAEQLKLVTELYGVTQTGNFEHKNILFRTESLKQYAERQSEPYPELLQRVEQLRQRLYQLREKRIHPFTDKKVLTAWNSMMITALVDAAKHLAQPEYLQAAIKAADYLNRYNLDKNNQDKTGHKLWRSSLNGQASVLASQEDYAYFSQALIRLYDATQEPKWLVQAEQISNSMLELFWDKNDGGFFMDNPSQEMTLMIRPKDIFDGAIPSGNSVAMEVMSALFKRTGKAEYENKAEQLMAALSAKVAEVPNAFSYLLMALNQMQQGEVELVQYGARGKLRVELVPLSIMPASASVGKREYLLRVKMEGKWHINSHFPLQDDLIKTDIYLQKAGANHSQVLELQSVEYPDAIEKRLSFNDTLLSLYENEVIFKVKLKPEGSQSKGQNKPVIPLVFSYQACSDKICLSPEKLSFYLYP